MAGLSAYQRRWGVDRQQRGWNMFQSGSLRRLPRNPGGAYIVDSQRLVGVTYSVRQQPDGSYTCTCPDYRRNSWQYRFRCKHIYVVLFHLTGGARRAVRRRPRGRAAAAIRRAIDKGVEDLDLDEYLEALRLE